MLANLQSHTVKKAPPPGIWPALPSTPALNPSHNLPSARTAANDDVAACSAIVPADLGLGPQALSFGPTVLGRNAVPDFVRSEKLPGGQALAATSLETAALQMLVCDPSVEKIVPRGHVLSYSAMRNGGRHEHVFVPDVVFRRFGGEVCTLALLPSWERNPHDPAWISKAADLRAAYRSHGVTFLAWTERMPFARIPRRNREFMLERAGAATEVDLQKVRSAIDLHGLPSSVGALARRARLGSRSSLNRLLTCLTNLALKGEVALDMSRPFDGGSRVSAGPRLGQS
ncbi:hypothetical protein [Enterovirga aerilata]|uniref:TnsA endonuclease N-terminal domain-containing protein n=1 Tax=Enterovirga aerilata TaxID=2730920 RepID=A0A849IE00_9HYPH|nr:hypothetical protein [Enterovirga sp. DB1703]NNM74207.1 hypothetical protein [Enterovirga sp. DB1703]